MAETHFTFPHFCFAWFPPVFPAVLVLLSHVLGSAVPESLGIYFFFQAEFMNHYVNCLHGVSSMYICVPSARWVYLIFLVPVFLLLAWRWDFCFHTSFFLLNLDCRWLTCTGSPPQALPNIFSHHQKGFTHQSLVWIVFNNNSPPFLLVWLHPPAPLRWFLCFCLFPNTTCSEVLGFHSCWIPATFISCLSEHPQDF